MRRRKRRPDGLRLALLLVVVAMLLLAGVALMRGLLGALNRMRGGGTAARDPQFAEPAEQVTRPPELSGEPADIDRPDDPSANWVEENQTPVDKTAGELSREAEAGEGE